jgi:hypothetical protein
MPVRVELWVSDALVDGVEQWWDAIEAALDQTQGDFVLLESISPYGETRVPADRLEDMAEECRRLASQARRSVAPLLLRIAELCEAGARTDDGELRFEGD